jgi:hypothetical protein
MWHVSGGMCVKLYGSDVAVAGGGDAYIRKVWGAWCAAQAEALTPGGAWFEEWGVGSRQHMFDVAGVRWQVYDVCQVMAVQQRLVLGVCVGEGQRGIDWRTTSG